MKSCNLLGTWISATSYSDACETVGRWISSGERQYICVSTVHMIMEGYDDPEFQKIVNGAGLVTPDGMPLVWYLRKHGYPNQQRVYGPTLMPELLTQAAEKGWKVGLYGGDQETLDKLLPILKERYPKLEVAYAFSPPFRPLTPEERDAVREEINSKGVDVLFVGLGCPKQERWMKEQQGHVNCVMLGVGAAFPFLAQTVKQAPSFLQKAGLEWLYRMVMEPKRLWKRYLKTNPRFVYLVLTSRFRKSATS